MNEVQMNAIENLLVFCWVMAGLSTATFAVAHRWRNDPAWYQAFMWGATVMIWPLYWAGVFIEKRFSREPLQMRVVRPITPPSDGAGSSEEPTTPVHPKHEMSVCGFCPGCEAYTTADENWRCAICGAQLPF